MSEGTLRDDRDATSDIVGKLVRKGAMLRFLEEEAHTWLFALNDDLSGHLLPIRPNHPDFGYAIRAWL